MIDAKKYSDNELITEIRTQLSYCDTVKHPYICMRLDDNALKDQIICFVYDKINDGLDSIAEALNQIEAELNPATANM